MKFWHIVRGVVCTLMVSSTAISAQNELLASQDVSRIMQQILDQHVNQNQMSAAILQSSFRIYIDQFDPHRIYLLQDEVQPYLNMSDNELKRVLEQYRNNDLSAYEELNKVIQKSIVRANEIRKQIEKEDFTSITPNPAQVSPPFAKNIEELKQRQRENLVKFLDTESRRYGPAYLKNNNQKLIVFYEKKQDQFEAQYMPTEQMTAESKNHQFLIHVLKSLASSLDSHTNVMDSEEAFDMRVRLQKGFDGIGITLAEQPDGIFITGMIKEGPAARNGKIKLGDKIVEIDGQPAESLGLDLAEEKLRGQSGTTINLVLERPGQQSPFTVSLQRETIVINEGRAEVSYESFGNGIIGKIKLDSFYQGPNGISSLSDVQKGIQELDKKGNLRGLILDMRENTGGFLSQAIKVAGLFITNGVVVISRYHDGEERFYRDMDSAVMYDGPLVILTSRATASAAEIVAQALQDYGVAVIVGDEQTYGKGTIQSQTVTSDDGTGSYFKVTVGKYYTVSGKTPQIQGVKADVVVPGKFSQLTLGEEYLEYPVETAKKDVIDPAYKDALTDIQPTLKSWYMRYYMPTLQKPRTQWKDILPKLRENSAYRVKENKNYQIFLKKIKGEEIKSDNPEAETDEYGRVKHTNFGQEDLQMQEAVNVVKDMIYLQPTAEKHVANQAVNQEVKEEAKAAK